MQSLMSFQLAALYEGLRTIRVITPEQERKNEAKSANLSANQPYSLFSLSHCCT